MDFYQVGGVIALLAGMTFYFLLEFWYIFLAAAVFIVLLRRWR